MTEPIFFLWARSFWLGAISILSALGAMAPHEVEPAVWLIASMFTDTPDEVAAGIVGFLPVVSAVSTGLALQQRSGAARPYTMKIKGA